MGGNELPQGFLFCPGGWVQGRLCVPTNMPEPLQAWRGGVIVPGCFPVSDQMARLRSTAPWPGGTAAGYRGQRWPSERGLKGQREPVIQGDVCVCMDMCVLPCV